MNKDAAWYYPHSSPLARKIRNHVAFWNGVQVDARTAQAQEAPEAGTPQGLQRPANRECRWVLRG